MGNTPNPSASAGATPTPAAGATPTPAAGATPAPAAGATPTPAAGATPVPAAGAGAGAAAVPATTLIDVDFDLITPDGTRKINFRLTKTLQGADIVWTINFSLFERKDTTKPFDTDPNVHLAVTVDKAANDKAEKAAKEGLTTSQAAQATGPASIVAKAAQTNPALKPAADKEVQKVVTHA